MSCGGVLENKEQRGETSNSASVSCYTFSWVENEVMEVENKRGVTEGWGNMGGVGGVLGSQAA